MYDTDRKNGKKGKKFITAFIVFGLVFLAIFGILSVSELIKYKSLDYQVEATRIDENSHYDSDNNLMYSPIYYYEVDGKEYVCKTTSSASTPPTANQKIVYYDSKNPSKCMTSFSKSVNTIFIIFTVLPIIMIVIGIIKIKKVNNRVKQINALNNTGKLVKNLPYHLEDSGMTVNNVKIQLPVVEYTLPSGERLTLKGDPRHDRKLSDQDGLVDLVIDETNPSNYFIDFEINRLSGNLSTDYYTQPGQNAINNNMPNSASINNVEQSAQTINANLNNTQSQENSTAEAIQNN